MTTIVESGSHFLVGAQASIVDAGDRLLAWAERYVRKDPDIRWILGNFVEADNANDNGHIFPLDDLRSAFSTINNKPLNMLHHERFIVGAFAGSELLEQPGENAAENSSVVEALAAFWASNFPEEYSLVERAHKEGSLYYSMECIPRSLSCPEQGCLAQDRPYMGRQHASYCDHMNALRGPKRLNQPHFNAGALIIPPVQPGWRKADITELSQLLNEHAEEAERVYASLQADLPHLDAAAWEALMGQIMAMAFDDIAAPVPELRGHGAVVRLDAAGQIAKDLVHYRRQGTGPDPDAGDDPDGDDATDPDNCASCRHGVFVYDASGAAVGSMCELVAGRIEQDDVCDLFDEVPENVHTETWPSYGKPGADSSIGTLLAKKFNAERRRQLAQDEKSLPDGSFLIEDSSDLQNAIESIGQASDQAKAKKHIKKRAKTLGKPNMVPSGW